MTKLNNHDFIVIELKKDLPSKYIHYRNSSNELTPSCLTNQIKQPKCIIILTRRNVKLRAKGPGTQACRVKHLNL